MSHSTRDADGRFRRKNPADLAMERIARLDLRELHSVTVDEEPAGTWNVWRAGELVAEHSTREDAERDADELAEELETENKDEE